MDGLVFLAAAEFRPAAENPPKNYCGRRKRRRILESRSAADKNPAKMRLSRHR